MSTRSVVIEMFCDHKVQVDFPAMNADVGDYASRADDLLTERKRRGDVDRLDRGVDAVSVREGFHILRRLSVRD
jgi:hypothetical protein